MICAVAGCSDLEGEDFQVVTDRVQARLQNWVSAHRRRALELHDLEHGLRRHVAVLLVAVSVDVPARDLAIRAEVSPVHVAGVELVGGSSHSMTLEDLHLRDAGLRVVGQDAETIAIDQSPGHPHGLQLPQVVASGQVATGGPVAEIVLVGNGHSGVAGVGLSHKAVTDGDQHGLVDALLVDRAVADGPAGRADHRQARAGRDLLALVGDRTDEQHTPSTRVGRAGELRIRGGRPLLLGLGLGRGLLSHQRSTRISQFFCTEV